MKLSDLIFIVSFFLVLFLIVSAAIYATRGKWASLRRVGIQLCSFLLLYAALLAVAGWSTKRRLYRPGERRCFDEWCVSALTVEVAYPPSIEHCRSDPRKQIWLANIEIASEAQRVRQSARDATVSLEDEHGHIYSACAAAMPLNNDAPHTLQDALDPGQSLRVLLPFQIPLTERPKGVVIRHGYFPEILLIGAEQSLFHANALSETKVVDHR